MVSIRQKYFKKCVFLPYIFMKCWKEHRGQIGDKEYGYLILDLPIYY